MNYARSGGCAADPTSDAGTTLPSFEGLSATSSGSQVGSDQLLPGAWILCAWLVDDGPSGNTVTPAPTNPLRISIAAAETAAMTVSPAPVQGRTLTVTASGVSYDSDAVLSMHHTSGSGTCAPSPQADHGTDDVDDLATGTGNYSRMLSNTLIFGPGSYRLCAWLIDQATGTVLAAAQQLINVPGLGAKLSFKAPSAVAAGSYFAFTFDATLPADVPVTAIVDAFNKAHRKSCPATPEAAPGANQQINEEVNDTTGSSGSVVLPGSFASSGNSAVLLCGWLEDAWSQAVPAPVVAGPVAATVTQAGNDVFHGHTSQHKAMTIFATPFARQIMAVNFTAVLHCNGTPRLPSGARWNGVTQQTPNYLTIGAVRPDHQGRFAIRLTKNPNHVFTLRGRVVGRTVTGTFTERGRSWVYTQNDAQNLACTTGRVHFTLHR